VIGRRIEVVADLHRVKIFCDGKTVADHERPWARHQTITDPKHLQAAKASRRTRVGALRPVRDPHAELAVEQRPLSDYDTALGIDLDIGLGSDADGGFAP
jgi:hypothetical protein